MTVLEAPIQAAIGFCFLRERKLGEILFGVESKGQVLLYKEKDRWQRARRTRIFMENEKNFPRKFYVLLKK